MAKVLFLSSEVAPFSKTGGLGDVAGSLPHALARRGHEVLVATPRYGTISLAQLEPAGVPALPLRFPYGEVTVSYHRRASAPNLTHLFIDEPGSFARERIYGESDDHRRFALFGVAALSGALAVDFEPDVVHLNDWPTGLAAVALGGAYSTTPLGRAKCVMTVHNLAYQGNFGREVMAELGLPWSQYSVDGFEFHGQVSFLKAGLQRAHAITTVSPTYAREIQTPEGGHGFDGVLRARGAAVHGILNGIDTAEWNPLTDKHLPSRFSGTDLRGKEGCGRALRQRLGLTLPSGSAPRTPLFGLIGRLVEQKGVALSLEAMPALLQRGAQAVVVGTGEERFVKGWKALRERYPGQLGVYIGFDEALAHLVEAGADFFIMPSHFEPCGLNQMYSLRYGAVPIVRATGGLRDSVVPWPHPAATGIVFEPYTAAALTGALEQAWALFEQPPVLDAMRRRGMAQDFSWDRSAAAYEALYASLM